MSVNVTSEPRTLVPVGRFVCRGVGKRRLSARWGVGERSLGVCQNVDERHLGTVNLGDQELQRDQRDQWDQDLQRGPGFLSSLAFQYILEE